MVQTFKVLLFVFMIFFGSKNLYGQLGVGQEIGVVAGPIAFFSDYGLRYDFETNTGNIGTGIGLVHYLNFAFKAECDCYSMYSYFNDHFKLRTEINYSKTRLEHFGKVAKSPGPRGQMLRAMKGSSEIVEFGAHLEYFPLSIRDYTAYAHPFSPFISLGANFVYFQPGAYSMLGPLKNHLISEFQKGTGELGGVSRESGTTWAIVGGLGMRYRLGGSHDLVMNAQMKYYHTDWLDGLNHDNPQNRANDFLFWLSFGYIYYLNF